MDSLPKITREKILQNTINSTEFYDVAEPHKVLPKLCVRVYPRLEEVDFYRGHSIPEFAYVPASSQAHRKLRKQRDSGRIRERCELSDLLNHFKQGQLIFIGQAGSGKSTLLKAIAREVIDGKYEGLKDVDIVHHIQCHNFRRGDKITLGELLFQNMNPKLSDEEIKQTLEYAATNPNRFLFILDSLDTLSYTIDGVYEQPCITDCASPEAVLWNFLAGKLVPGCRIITSSREHSIRNYQGEVRAQKVIALMGLSMDSIRKIIVGYVGEKEAEEIMQYMEYKSPALMDLSATPVFLTYNLVGFKCGDDFKPSTMSGILILLLNSLIRSPHAHEENILEVIDKLQELSFTGTKERRVLFSTREFARFGLEPKAVTDLSILAPGGLTQRILLGSDLMFFAHQSIQELLTAMYIAQMPRESFLTFLKDSIHTSHYAVVRRILCGLLLDDEVKDQAEQYFQGNLNVEENQDLLRQSLREQLSPSRRNKGDTLELYLSLSEAKNGMKEAISSSVQMIDLRHFPLSPSDAHAVGWVASNCKQLSKLSLYGCHLTSASVNAMVLNLRDCDLKVSTLRLSSNTNMGVTGLKSVGEISKQSKVEDLYLAGCNLSPQQLQALNDGLNSTKLTTLNLWENTEMGEEGLKTVGGISKQCRVEQLNLTYCELSSQELQALKEGLDSTKLTTLYLWGNTEMGEEGLKTVGGISKQCRVEELNLDHCQLSPQELQALKEGLDSAKIQKLHLWEDKTSHEHILALSELIPHVTELLVVNLLGIDKKYIDYLQQQLNRCSPTQLKMKCGRVVLSTNRQVEVEQGQEEGEEGENEEEEREGTSALNNEVSTSGTSQICNPREAPARNDFSEETPPAREMNPKAKGTFIKRPKTMMEPQVRKAKPNSKDTAGDSEVVQVVDSVGCSPQRSAQKECIDKEGGELNICGCKIAFPRNSLKEKKEIEVSICPDVEEDLDISGFDYDTIAVSSTFQFKPSVKFEKPVTIEMATCLRSIGDNKIPVVVLSKNLGKPWEFLAQAFIDDKGVIRFETLHFCKLRSILNKLYAYWFGWSLKNELYINKDTTALASVFTKEFKNQMVEDELRKKGYITLPVTSEELNVKVGDEVEFWMECNNPEGTNIIPPKASLAITEDILKKVKNQEHFEMVPSLDEQPGKVRICYHVKSAHEKEKRLPFRLSWPIRERETPSAVHREQHDGMNVNVNIDNRENIAANYMARSGGKIDAKAENTTIMASQRQQSADNIPNTSHGDIDTR